MDEGFYSLKIHGKSESGKVVGIDYSSQRDPGYTDTAAMVSNSLKVILNVNIIVGRVWIVFGA